MYTYFMCFGQEEEKKLQNVNKIFRLAGQPTRYILCIYIYMFILPSSAEGGGGKRWGPDFYTHDFPTSCNLLVFSLLRNKTLEFV